MLCVVKKKAPTSGNTPLETSYTYSSALTIFKAVWKILILNYHQRSVYVLLNLVHGYSTTILLWVKSEANRSELCTIRIHEKMGRSVILNATVTEDRYSLNDVSLPIWVTLYIAHWSRTRSNVPIYLVEKLHESCRTSSQNFQNDFTLAWLISNMVSPILRRVLGTAWTALYLEKLGKVLLGFYHFCIDLKTFIGI